MLGKPPTPLSRSEQMSRIRGKDTGPEQRLRRALWRAGHRYRLHYKTPVGRPDVVFPGRRVAVFIDGCFWHGCPTHYVRPRSREDLWREKLRANVERDRRQTLELEGLDWRIVRLWEHLIYEDLDSAVRCVEDALLVRQFDTETEWRVVRVDPIDDALNLERRHLEKLRDPDQRRTVEGRRYTTKWKRPTTM